MRSCDAQSIENNLKDKKQEEQKLTEKINTQKIEIFQHKITLLTKEEQKALYEQDIEENETQQQWLIQENQKLFWELIKF